MSWHIYFSSKNDILINFWFNCFCLTFFIINKLSSRLNNNVYFFIKSILFNLQHNVPSLVRKFFFLLLKQSISDPNLIFAVIVGKFTFRNSKVPSICSIWLFKVINKYFCFFKCVRAIIKWWWAGPLLYNKITYFIFGRTI